MKPLTEEEKKNYVKSTIIQGNGKRITEVLNRYFSSVKKNELPKNNKVITTEEAIKMFS